MKNNLVFGVHSINAILARDPVRFIEIFIQKDRKNEELINEIQRLGLRFQFVDKKWLDKQTDSQNHQGVLATIKEAKTLNENDLFDLLNNIKNPFLLILDGITDPHNLGACLRSADAAGVNAVIIPKDRAASLNSTVRKVACGATESVPLIAVTNLARTLRKLKEENDIFIVGTAGEAKKTLYEIDFNQPIAIVMGAEDNGIRRLIRESCDELAKLPMFGLVSSLNVSVATGICLFECIRQRMVN